MFLRSVSLVAVLFCQQAHAQFSVEDSLDTIARILQTAETERQMAETHRPSARVTANNTAYLQNVIGQMQQQLALVSQNANLAVAGWREAEKDKATLQAKRQELENEVAALRREVLAQRKLIEKYKTDQDIIIKGNDAYFAIFAKTIGDRDEAGVKLLLKSIWENHGGTKGTREFDVKILRIQPQP